LREVIYPILEFKEKKQTFAKIEEGKINFFFWVFSAHFSLGSQHGLKQN
jgi:hypothetical protein